MLAKRAEMIKETVRSLTEPERRCLRKRVAARCPVNARDTVKWAMISEGGLLLLDLLAAGLIALQLNPIVGGIGGGIIFVAGIVCLYAFIAVISGFFRWRRHYRDFSTDTLPAVRRVLEEGRVASRDVTASDVYEIQECEDEGPGYIFAIGDGKCLLLKGQKYAPEEDRMPWPARQFALVRSIDGQLWIGLFSSGETLSPSRTIEMAECTEEFIWSDREAVLDGQPEDILKGIKKSGQSDTQRLTR